MRSLHPRPYSRIDNHVERAGENLNAILLFAMCGAILAWIVQATDPMIVCKNCNKRPAIEQKLGDISETKYTLAVASGGSEGRKVKLTEEQIAEMDMWAAKATNPDDIERMKPKAKAVYYASLNRKKSIWSAIQ